MRRVLVTGASGYIGSRVARLLAARGDDVRGLVRDIERAPAGITPVQGLLERPDWLEGLGELDAIVHTAFPDHGRSWPEAVDIEAAFLRELVARFQGSETTVIVSNGSIFLGDSGQGRHHEDAAVLPEHPAAQRAEATSVVTRAGDLRGIELRLASFVYGDAGSVFLPRWLDYARQHRHVPYIDDGHWRASALHVEAAAQAYLDALDHGRAGAVYHIASEEEPTILQMAQALAQASGCPMVSLSRDELARVLDPFVALFLSTNNRLDARRARRHLQWHHAGYTPLLWDVACGSYAS